MAILSGHLKVVKLLIEEGANIKTRSCDGWTALHSISHRGHLEMAKLLIEEGANIEAQNIQGQTALYIAGREGNLKWLNC